MKTISMMGAAAVLIGAAAATAPVMAQSTSEDIVIYGRWHDRVPDSAPSASQVVSYADLDLSTDWGRSELRHRIRLASRYLCDKLNEGASDPITGSCRDQAYRDAMDRIGTVEAHFAPRGSAWVRPAPWTTPWTADWAARYPDDR